MLDEILLQEIAKFVRRKDGFFILDEIYQGLVHETGSYSSGLAVSDDLFVINSFSKFWYDWLAIGLGGHTKQRRRTFLKIDPEPDHFT